jgi:hypothetical protein
MGLAAGGVHGQGRLAKGVVRATHVALRGELLRFCCTAMGAVLRQSILTRLQTGQHRERSGRALPDSSFGLKFCQPSASGPQASSPRSCTGKAGTIAATRPQAGHAGSARLALDSARILPRSRPRPSAPAARNKASGRRAARTPSPRGSAGKCLAGSQRACLPAPARPYRTWHACRNARSILTGRPPPQGKPPAVARPQRSLCPQPSPCAASAAGSSGRSSSTDISRLEYRPYCPLSKC